MGERFPELWRALSRAAVLAGAAFLGAAGYVYYLTIVAFPDRIDRRFGAASREQILRVDMAMIALLVVVAALVGSIFAKRYRLAGLGTFADLRRSLLLVLTAGPALSIFSYLAYGLAIVDVVPGYYPRQVIWALAVVAKGVLFDEVVARYGMMTIFAGVTPKLWLANLLQATFFTAMVFKSLSFYGLAVVWNAYFLSSLATAFGSHLIYGGLYAKRGLYAAMALHLVVDLRFVAHALVFG